MPNTLAHLGAQTPLARAIFRGGDPKWIYLGCVVPDLPWIVQRAVCAVAPGVDPFDLRLYAIAQSTLAVSLLLCGALSALSRAPRRVFGLLSLGALLHLLLDATQTKWGNGVHLLAPLSWKLVNWGLFWPESPVTWALTGLGPLVVAWLWWRPGPERIGLVLTPGRGAVALALLALYAAAPVPLGAGAEAADNHSVRALRRPKERSGRTFALDRAWYDPAGPSLETFAGDRLRVAGGLGERAGVVSVRGRFLDAQRVRVTEAHRHAGRWRDYASYLGLSLVAAAWLGDLRRTGRQPPG